MSEEKLIRVKVTYDKPVGNCGAVTVFLSPGEQKQLPCGSTISAEVYEPPEEEQPPTVRLTPEAREHGRKVAARLSPDIVGDDFFLGVFDDEK